MKKSLFSNDPVYKPYVFKGLRGRYGHWLASEPKAKRTFVLLYGQHATLERIVGIVEVLRQYGDVYMVDTPGFGGMDSPYKIGRTPNLDFYAEHLNNFVDNYIPKARQITFMGISYGFQIVTKTLANYPDICKRTEVAISFVGFVSYKDFDMPLSYKILLMYCLTNFGRTRLGNRIMSPFISGPVLNLVLRMSKPFNVHYKTLQKNEVENYINQQIWLWTVNDNHTHAVTAWDFFKKTDLSDLKIDAAVIHAGVDNDHYFKNDRIVEELKNMYKDCQHFELDLDNHAPLEAKPDEVSELIPDKLKVVLRKSKNKEAVIV